MCDPEALHRELLIIDTHADTTQRLADEHWTLLSDLGGGHLNLATARAGNLQAEFFAIWPEPTEWRGRYAERAFSLINAVRQAVADDPCNLALCRSSSELLAARENGQFGLFLGIEGGHAIENSLDLLRRFFSLGVRYMTLTWANSNAWADSSGDLDDAGVLHHGGLTAFGREVVEEMNRLGMLIDVSHVSDATFFDVLRTSRTPVLATHSSARALCASPRNLSDNMLRALAHNGGACMVNFYPAFLDDAWRAAWTACKDERDHAQHNVSVEYRQLGQPVPHHASNRIDRIFAARMPPLPLSRLVDHIDHVAQVAGIDHVGIGSDFDGICALPEGIASAADLPRLTAALCDRGYDRSSIAKIMGGNLLRVLRAGEAAADEPSATG